MSVIQTTPPLRAIRESKGLTAAQVAKLGREIHPEFPDYEEAIQNWERRGIRDYIAITVLAQIYEKTPGEIAAAAIPTKS